MSTKENDFTETEKQQLLRILRGDIDSNINLSIHAYDVNSTRKEMDAYEHVIVTANKPKENTVFIFTFADKVAGIKWSPTFFEKTFLMIGEEDHFLIPVTDLTILVD